jgi:tetratricopeptide (TPR) repeat protein
MRKAILLIILAWVAIGGYFLTPLRYKVDALFSDKEAQYLKEWDREYSPLEFQYDPDVEKAFREQVAAYPEKDPFGYPVGVVWPPRLRGLFVDGRFQELSAELKELQARVEEDIHYEYALWDAYQVFSWPDPVLQERFDGWVEVDKSYVPVVARGMFYAQLAAKGRGGLYANETPEKRFEIMHKYLDLASADFKEALRLEPASFMALLEYASIAMYSDGVPVTLFRYDKGIARYPTSFLFHSSQINPLQPKWGGSWELVAERIDGAQEYAEENNKLRMLKGELLEIQAREAWRNKDKERALALMDEALKLGPYSGFYSMKSHLHSDFNPKASWKANEKCLEQRPTFAWYNYQRGQLAIRLGRFEYAASAFRAAAQLDPYSYPREKAIKYCRDKAYKWRSSRPQRALAIVDVAVAINPESSDAHWNRGATRWSTGDLEGALVDYERAMEINPQEMQQVDNYTAILLQLERKDQAISTWNTVVESSPENGEAVYGRSKFYERLGQEELAIRDMKQGCDQGYRVACEDLRRNK